MKNGHFYGEVIEAGHLKEWMENRLHGCRQQFVAQIIQCEDEGTTLEMKRGEYLTINEFYELHDLLRLVNFPTSTPEGRAAMFQISNDWEAILKGGKGSRPDSKIRKLVERIFSERMRLALVTSPT